MDVTPFIGKVLIACGVLAIIVGIVLLAFPKFRFFRIPGDISITSGSTSISFPIVTCLLVSVVLTVVLNLILFLGKK